MEPITLILTALAAGAAAAAHSVGGEALKDAYKGLKALIQRKISGDSKAETTLEDYEQDAEVYEKPLRKYLVAVQADKDEELIKQAQKLMQLTDAKGTQQGKYNIQFRATAIGVAIGDNAQVINFTEVKRMVDEKIASENQKPTGEK